MVVGAVVGLVPAGAQVPSVLEEIKLITEDEQQSSFLLTFSPREPDFAPINNNPSQPALTMRATLRAPRVPERGTYRGLVRTTQFVTSDGNLLFRFDAIAPASLSAEKVGANAVKVTVNRVSEAEATGSRPIGSASEQVDQGQRIRPRTGRQLQSL